MAKRIILIMALAALLGATAAEATSFEQSKRGRKYLQGVYFVENLQRDMLAVYQQYGYPLHRLRVCGYGRVVERWTYYEVGLEFTFDENSVLLGTRTFWPEDRRERLDRYPGY